MVGGRLSLPQFLVSARFGAANMQIPCSFYFGSVFFSHTFRSAQIPPLLHPPIGAHRILCFCFASAVPCFLPMSLRFFISTATSSLLCIAHFTFLLKGDGAGEGEAMQKRPTKRTTSEIKILPPPYPLHSPLIPDIIYRKNRNEIFIIRQSKIFFISISRLLLLQSAKESLACLGFSMA